jgi:predicted site-specific integrase-resolvase
VSKVFGDFSRDVANKKKICYARLSSDHRREKSQVRILDKLYPGTAIIKDIGSGLNFKKKGLYPFWTESIQEKSRKLLSCTMTDCEDLVLDSWNSSAKKAACRIVVYSKANRSEQAVTRELSKVLSIVIVFIAKNNRLRCRNRKRRQKIEESQKIEGKIDKKRISR